MTGQPQESSERIVSQLKVDPSTGYSRDPWTNIELALDYCERPIDAYNEMLASAVKELPPQVRHKRDALKVRDYLLIALRAWRPMRLATISEIAINHFHRTDDDHYAFTGGNGGNRGEEPGRPRPFTRLPPEVMR